MSPWIRMVAIDGRIGLRWIWLTTGDLLTPSEPYPTCILPQVCALCGATVWPFLSQHEPVAEEGRINWYCKLHLYADEELSKRMKARGAETDALIQRLYPVFDPTAAPGEEWNHAR